jgi:hypothetical protein
MRDAFVREGAIIEKPGGRAYEEFSITLLRDNGVTAAPIADFACLLADSRGVALADLSLRGGFCGWQPASRLNIQSRFLSFRFAAPVAKLRAVSI